MKIKQTCAPTIEDLNENIEIVEYDNKCKIKPISLIYDKGVNYERYTLFFYEEFL